MKKFFLLISVIILDIACIFNFWPKFELYLKFKSIFQLGEVVSQLSEITLLTALAVSILISSKRVYVILFGLFTSLLGNIIHFTLDIYNSYFTFRNLTPRIGYILLFSSIIYLLLLQKNKSNIIKNLGFLAGVIASGVVAYEKIRAGIFQANIFTYNTLYGIGMVTAVITAWIMFNKHMIKAVNEEFNQL